MKELSPEELQKLVFSQGRRIAALESHLRNLDSGFELPQQPMVAVPKVAEVPAELKPVSPPVPEPAAAPLTESPALTPVTVDVLPPPEPPPTPVYHPEFPQPAMPAASSFQPFLSEREYTAPPELPRPAVASPASIETRLGANWLVRIGGVLLLIGAALGAMLIQPLLPPVGRVFFAALFAVALGGAGFWIRRFSEIAGRSLVAIAFALGYFVAFSSHYIAPTRIFDTAFIPLIAMIVIAGGLVALAERWQSQFVAGFGLFLGVIAALISAQTTTVFALVALSLLAVAAGVLLIRNEWLVLTALALVGTYAAMVILWIILGKEGLTEVVFPHLGALLLYHVVFSLAFWKWSRPWMAREIAMETAPEQEAIPALRAPMLPYSTAFAILNSLGLVSLSVLLLGLTETYWPKVHILLFALMGLELFRLSFAAFRRGSLASFHWILAMGLLTGGLVSAFGGLAESTMLAVQALVLVIAGTRARPLRWMRPIATIPAFLTVHEFSPGGAVTLADLAATLAAPVVILLTTLPWEAIWVHQPKPFYSGFLRVLDKIAQQSRSLLAVTLCAAVLSRFTGSIGEMAPILGIFATILLLGIILLGAHGWILGAMAISAAAPMVLYSAGTSSTLRLALCMTLGALIILLWDDVLRRVRSDVGRVLVVLFTACFAAVMAFDLQWSAALAAPWSGPLAAVYTLIIGALAMLLARTGRLPAIITAPVSEESPEPARLRPVLVKFTCSSFAAALFVVSVIWLCIAEDAPISPVSSAAMAFVLLAAWASRRGISARPAVSGALLAAGLFVGTIGAFVYTKGALTAAAPAAIAGLLCFAYAHKRSPHTDVVLAMAALLGIGALSIGVHQINLNNAPLPAACGLLAAAIIIAAAAMHAVMSGPITIESSREARALRHSGVLLTIVGTALALISLAKGTLLAGMFITVSWGIVALLLLFCGFLFLDAGMRYTSMVVFGLAVFRTFFHDLAHSNAITRVVAFIGVGILLIVAGVAYGVLSKRLLREKPVPAPPE